MNFFQNKFAQLRARTDALQSRRSAVVVATGTAMGLSAGGAHAATYTMDLSDVLTTVGAGVTTISSLGLAVLSLVVIVKMFKWARSAL